MSGNGENLQFVLTALDPPIAGQKFTIPGDLDKIHIGRSVDNEIPIDLPSISRHHAVLLRDRNRFRITDAGSRNGIAVDGRETRDAFLVPGCVVTIGDVSLRLDIADRDLPGATPADGEAAAPAPRPGARQTVEVRTIASPAEAEDEAGQDKGPVHTLRTALVMIFLALLILGLVFAGYMYMQRARRPRVLTLSPVLVRVNEQRLISTRQIVRLRGRALRAHPDFVEDSIRIQDPDVAHVRKFEEKQFVVSGRSSGSTTVTMRSLRGNLIRLRVVVRGKLADPLEPYRRLPNDLDVRRPAAQRHVAAGDRVLKDKPYAALRQYRIALEIMKPFSAHQPCGMARQRVESTEAKVERLYRELRSTVRQSAETGEVPVYEETVQQLLELIPDPNDPRHQFALYLRQNLIRVMERRKKR